MLSKRISSSILSLLCTSSLLYGEAVVIEKTTAQSDFVDKESIREGLHSFNHLYKNFYALKKWKQRVFGWTPDSQLKKQLEKLASHSEPLLFDDVKSLYSGYFLPLDDRHLSIQYEDTRLFSFPISIAIVDQKIVVTKEHEGKIQVGDQIVAINGVSPATFGKKHHLIAPNEYQSTASTRKYRKWRALARERELQMLVTRLKFLPGCFFPCPPPGPLQVTFERRGADGNSLVFTEEVQWEQGQFHYGKEQKNQRQKRNDFSLTMLTENEKKIALIRISSFGFLLTIDEPALFDLFSSIQKARTESDAIIIDLRNNGGGLADTAAFIASCFVTKPRIFMYNALTPTHWNHMRSSILLELYEQTVKQVNLELASLAAKDPKSDRIAPLKAFLRHQGELLSESRSYLNEHNSQTTRKLILSNYSISPSIPNAPSPATFILQNSNSGSASECFAGFMQSSKTAKVVGILSGGATSGVQDFTLSPHKGVGDCSITTGFTLIEENGKKRIIEDIGIIPDIEIRLEMSDLLSEDQNHKKDPILSKLVKKIVSEDLISVSPAD